MTTRLNQQWKFKTDHPLDKRRDIVRKLRESYPDRVPIIIEPDTHSQLGLSRVRFLAPHNSTLQKLFIEIRKQTLENDKPMPDMALFVLFGDAQIMAPMAHTVGQLYAQCADPEDGMLYGRLMRESTFGHSA
jgi:hypothetical protein